MKLKIYSIRLGESSFALELNTKDKRCLDDCYTSILNLCSEICKKDMTAPSTALRELSIYENMKHEIVVKVVGISQFDRHLMLSKDMISRCCSGLILYKDLKTDNHKILYLSSKIIEYTSNVVENLIGACSMARIRLYKENNNRCISVTLED